jgi:hypothetical protein
MGRREGALKGIDCGVGSNEEWSEGEMRCSVEDETD